MAATPKLATMPASYYRGDDLLTVEEAAAELKVKKSWVYEQVKERAQIRSKNPLPYTKMEHLLRFSRMRIAEWLVENEHLTRA